MALAVTLVLMPSCSSDEDTERLDLDPVTESNVSLGEEAQLDGDQTGSFDISSQPEFFGLGLAGDGGTYSLGTVTITDDMLLSALGAEGRWALAAVEPRDIVNLTLERVQLLSGGDHQLVLQSASGSSEFPPVGYPSTGIAETAPWGQIDIATELEFGGRHSIQIQLELTLGGQGPCGALNGIETSWQDADGLKASMHFDHAVVICRDGDGAGYLHCFDGGATWEDVRLYLGDGSPDC